MPATLPPPRRPCLGWTRTADAHRQRVVVLADSTKLCRETLVRFARPADVDVLITDDGAEPEALSALEAAGVEVVVA